MIMAYKIITAKVNLKRENFFQFAQNQTNRKSHNYKLVKTKATKLVRQNTFSVRIVSDWNGLPQNIVGAESTDDFKRKLDEYWGPEVMYQTPF